MAFTAFCARPLNSELFLVMLGVKWYQCVTIICKANKDIGDVTSLGKEIVAYFLQSSGFGRIFRREGDVIHPLYHISK